MNFWDPAKLPLSISLPPSISRPLCPDPVTGRQQVAELNVYLRALMREMRSVAPEFDDYQFPCVTLAAASPSVLREGSDLPLLLADLYRLFHLPEDCELTFRVDPEQKENLRSIRYSLPENTRLELRLLSASAEELRALRRPFSVPDVADTLSFFRRQDLVGSPGVLLLLGLPGQTLSSVRDTILFALDQGFGQVRFAFWKGGGTEFLQELYLKEKRSFLKDLPEAEKDFQIEAFSLAADLLEQNGFSRFHRLLFARPGCVTDAVRLSAQTASCMGLGAGAATFLGGNGYQNTENLALYTKSSDSFEAIAENFQILEEADLLRLGTVSLLASPTGLSPENCHALFAVDPLRIFRDSFRHLVSEGILREEGGSWHLTRKGLAYLDELPLHLRASKK